MLWPSPAPALHTRRPCTIVYLKPPPVIFLQPAPPQPQTTKLLSGRFFHFIYLHWNKSDNYHWVMSYNKLLLTVLFKLSAKIILICVPGLRISVWLRFSLKLHLLPVTCLGTPLLTTSTWIKTCSTIINLLLSITHPAALTAPWHPMLLQSGPHLPTLQVQIQLTVNRDLTLRLQPRFWIQLRGLALWRLDWTFLVVDVRHRRILSQDQAVRIPKLWPRLNAFKHRLHKIPANVLYVSFF